MRRSSAALLCLLSASTSGQDGSSPVDKVRFARDTAVKAAELLRSDQDIDEVTTGLVRLVLNRKPTETEDKAFPRFLAGGKDRDSADREIIWALMNSLEFMKVMPLTDRKDIEETNKMLTSNWPER